MIPPPQMNNAERDCFNCLRDLYQRFRDKKIDEQGAICEKNKIQTGYRHDCMLREMFEECCNREYRLRKYASEIEKHGSEDAKRLLRILDGREK